MRPGGRQPGRQDCTGGATGPPLPPATEQWPAASLHVQHAAAQQQTPTTQVYLPVAFQPRYGTLLAMYAERPAGLASIPSASTT